ncbi:hypothetical protein K3495_g8489 [Podosphaera aphanis]|nr:hypothetical protein K3495_g8489 [Podosphaera aphanis]
MPLSNLMLTILEQAIEPLRCLHGAGYFTEEEWSQLDLIMNKKHVWTTGSDQKTTSFQSGILGTHRNTLARHETAPSDIHSDVDKISLSPEIISICTSTGPSTDEVMTPSVSMDTSWELSPAMASPAPSRPLNKDPSELLKLQSAAGLVSNFNKSKPLQPPAAKPKFVNNPPREFRPERTLEGPYTISRSDNTTLRHKSVSSWASEVLNGSLLKAETRPRSQASGLSSELIDTSNLDISLAPSTSTTNSYSYSGDVNAFETNNAAEWDELPPEPPKRQPKNDLSALIDEKFDKIADIIIQGSKENPQVSSKITALPSRTEIRNTIRTATTSRSTRRKEAKEAKEPKDRPTNPPPKTRTCWFWAESVGGCRYRPEECLNLHVRPEPGVLPKYPLKDGKPTWGSLADAEPGEVPAGKKPKTCWYWAARGNCEEEKNCEYVHGWVAGGVASRPAHVEFIPRLRYKISDEEPPERFSIEDDSEFDLDETDVGDKAPTLMIDMNPSSIASRIHAPEWFVKSGCPRS